MPLIQVKVIEGVFTEAQKHAIVRKLTDAMVAVEGENLRPVTWVVVEEIKNGNWGIGGQPMFAADVKALAGSNATLENEWADTEPSMACVGIHGLP